ncbi:MAG: DUF1684 domain-containing protein [Anaerolineales bacterium]
MITPSSPFTLATWRREVSRLYAKVRDDSIHTPLVAWDSYRSKRDDLFKTHPESPLKPEIRRDFKQLEYYPYHQTWRTIGRVDQNVENETIQIDLGADGLVCLTRVGRVYFSIDHYQGELCVYWIEGYGGGIFIPFRDATNGKGTYGGGRYLYDTIKGADLGTGSDQIVLDFNYAYNPSCAYDDRWVCPLAPQENWLNLAVEAGEMKYVPSFSTPKESNK